MPIATCASCHAKEAGQFARSVHATVGFDCLECHGGALEYRLPAERLAAYTQPPTQTKPTAATRPAFDHGKRFSGKPSRSQVPDRCGECHANVEFMNPYGLRTDQLARYRTSGHGKTLFAKKDDRVAVCIDCHGTHDVLGAKDPGSSINPLRVPDTCGRCHADRSLIAGYGLATTVVADYKASLHGRGLLEQGDTGMPTCATCHGNHAARPPGVRDVGHVCGRCHQQTETYFKEAMHAKLPDFPPCVGCHATSPDREVHKILPVTRSPEDLVKSYRSRWEQLVDDGVTAAQIDATLAKEMLRDDETFAVRLRTVCKRCHRPDVQVGHRVLFKHVDEGAIARGQTLDKMIREAELKYVETSARVDRVGHGELLVQSEAFALEQAKTQLIALSAIQHTLDEKRVTETAKNVLDACRQIESSLDEKEAGLHRRRWALAPMWLFLLVFIAALWTKYKRLKRVHVVPLRTPVEGV